MAIVFFMCTSQIGYKCEFYKHIVLMYNILLWFKKYFCKSSINTMVLLFKKMTKYH